MSLLESHHDGSELYVSQGAPSLGDTVDVMLRVPQAARADRVFVRTTLDAEPRFAEASVDRVDERETWWRASIRVDNPVVRYRFLLEDGAAPYRWVNAAGTFGRDVTDGADFWLTTFTRPPDWLHDTVAYQIFPDRFASSGATRAWPEWAHHSSWDEPVATDWKESTRQMFGGDLDGICDHLGHLQSLGIDTIYLTPFFPAHSVHRYDASTFDEVDPLLGGDAALFAFTAAVHGAGMRVVGDLTTNHTGDSHEWFRTAQQDRHSTEAQFYFLDSDSEEYVGWLGVKSLPKLDHRAPALTARMLSGPDSITGKWLRPPWSLDGWRIDVANMTGRLGDIDTNHDVARAIRATMAEVRPDAWLVAEHCYDASSDLCGDGWHGTMNYSGFTRPVWCWLRSEESTAGLMGFPSAPPMLDGESMVATMRDFIAAMPWLATTASMTLLGSHDTARWPSVAGDSAHQLAGLGLLIAYPGVPTIYYGDEVGLGGNDSDIGRAPMQWDHEQWDLELLEGYRTLIAVRCASRALQRGGLRWVHVGPDTVVFLREAIGDVALVQISRAAHHPVVLPCSELGMRSADPLYGQRQLVPHDGTVTLPDTGPSVHIWRLQA